ncbi:MAG: hypothetical protein R3F59_03290 [Myxococcota bacterium]
MSTTADESVSTVPLRTDPHSVIALMAEVADAAFAADVQVVHPSELEVAENGAVTLHLAARRPERSASAAPELAVGPSDTSLSYAIAAIGVLSALGALEAPPDDPEQHRAWVEAIVDRLETQWAGRWGADQVIDWIARCLAYQPDDRPEPHLLMEEILRARVRTRTPSSPRTGPSASIRTHTLRQRAEEQEQEQLQPPPRGVPWLPLVVGPILGFCIALCAMGAVLDRVANLVVHRPPAVRVTPSAPAPAHVPDLSGVAGVAALDEEPAQLEVDDEPAIAADGVDPAEPEPPAELEGEPDEVVAEAAPEPAPAAAREPVRRDLQPRKRVAPAPRPEPVPVEPEPEPARPAAGPASDLRDPWGS